jgi:hypothetical protein
MSPGALTSTATSAHAFSAKASVATAASASANVLPFNASIVPLANRGGEALAPLSAPSIPPTTMRKPHITPSETRLREKNVY